MRRHNATPHRTFARNDPKQGCKRVKQSGSDDYRRFDPAFTGTRSVLTLGAPGIDRDWIRRHRRGAGVVIVWYIAVPLLVMIGLASAWARSAGSTHGLPVGAPCRGPRSPPA